LAYKSSNPIIKIDIMIWDLIIDTIVVDNKNDWSYVWNIFIPASQTGKKADLVFRAVDDQYYSDTVTTEVLIVKKDTVAPEIILINPIDWSIKLYNNNFFNLKANIKEGTSLRTINIKIDWEIIKTWLTDRSINFPINSENDLSVWKHIITLEAIDKAFNKSEIDIKLEVLER
jgi:hypothetical protein